MVTTSVLPLLHDSSIFILIHLMVRFFLVLSFLSRALIFERSPWVLHSLNSQMGDKVMLIFEGLSLGYKTWGLKQLNEHVTGFLTQYQFFSNYQNPQKRNRKKGKRNTGEMRNHLEEGRLWIDVCGELQLWAGNRQGCYGKKRQEKAFACLPLFRDNCSLPFTGEPGIDGSDQF